MEPNQETEPQSAELPSPMLPQAASGEVRYTASPEAPPMQPAVGASTSQSGQLPAAQPDDPTAPSPASSSVAAAPVAMADGDSMIADDADLIEKEWVTRAKAIVEQTKEDPFQQNKAINKVKAEYIKKRYNKDLKVSES